MKKVKLSSGVLLPVLISLLVLFGFGCDGNGRLSENSPPQNTTEIPSVTESPSVINIFTNEDVLSFGVDLGDSPELVKSVLGEPNSVNSRYSYDIGAEVFAYVYDFGEIYFEPDIDLIYYTVVLVKVTAGDNNIIRNCKIGMEYREIIANFPNEHLGKNEFGEDVLYDIPAGEEKSYGVLGYYADGVPTGILYVYEGETKKDSRILQIDLSDNTAVSILLSSKYSGIGRWHFFEYKNGISSTDADILSPTEIPMLSRVEFENEFVSGISLYEAI